MGRGYRHRELHRWLPVWKIEVGFMRFAAAVLSLLVLVACRTPVSDTGGLDANQVRGDTLVLAPGQEVRVGAAFRVAFLEVSSDSRCPTDVVCIWAGNATVEIGLAVGMGPTYPFTLNTLLDPRSVDFSGYRVTLVDLTPYPVSTRRIPPDEYRAHLWVTLLNADTAANR
jgi:hypothetical protein